MSVELLRVDRNMVSGYNPSRYCALVDGDCSHGLKKQLFPVDGRGDSSCAYLDNASIGGCSNCRGKIRQLRREECAIVEGGCSKYGGGEEASIY